MTVLALGPEWLQPDTIISWLGPWALVGLAAIVFAECGLLLGFFLPGDSLLFTAGLFVANGAIGTPLWLVCLVLVAAAGPPGSVDPRDSRAWPGVAAA